MELDLQQESSDLEVISPWNEMGAYEALWCEDGATFKRLAEKFAEHPQYTPSRLVEPSQIQEYRDKVFELMGRTKFDVRVHGAGDYPERLRDAKYPVEVLYYQGDWSLIYSPTVAVVGTRKPSEDGIKRTQKLVRNLVSDGYTIVSGLADGIDTVAHQTAIELGGKTIAVIGTPLSESYPKANTSLQKHIRDKYLLISPVPFIRYSNQYPPQNRVFFPERNVVMSALTEGTIIVEASDTSGTMHQAKAAMFQRRKLFILESCFQNPNITWPGRFIDYDHAHQVVEYEDVRKHLCHDSQKSKMMNSDPELTSR